MGEVHNFSNPEGQRRLEAAKYQARNAEFVQFLRKAGVKEYVDLEKIAANPFVYEQRVVLTRARLMRMISRSEALFGWKNTVFVVTNVPATRFVDPREYSLAIQVEGVRKSQTVPEGPPILHVRYVGASDIASLNPDWYRERVAEAHGR
jgi:hypothetical protein